MPPKQDTQKTIETITHDEARRLNIPTTELSTVARREDLKPVEVSYRRRDPDLDPQLIWRGKYGSDQFSVDSDQPLTTNHSSLLVRAAPLYIQEKVHPKVLIDDLKRESEARARENTPPAPRQFNFFTDFNGIPEGVDKTEFYQHEQNWSNRLILGDSLQVMAGLAEREGLRGKVQCIYFDPPYGIKFNSNFQWSTTSRDVKDGNAQHITREPEQVKAFRDTWRDGIHSYLSYIRDRLIVARDLLTESGSIFVQIGDENVHRVRAVMDEVFGEDNFVSPIMFKKTGSMSGNFISGIADTVLWYAKNKDQAKFRRLLTERTKESIDSGFGHIELRDGTCRGLTTKELGGEIPIPEGQRFQSSPLMSSGETAGDQGYRLNDKMYYPAKGRHWAVSIANLPIVQRAGRLYPIGNTLTFKKYLRESPYTPFSNVWMDTMESTFAVQRIYVVQTSSKVIERCLLIATDPGDLVLDPTCGSGTTAYVAEQWGRRWITIDTSRVALALARARLMGARYPYYLLADSPEGQKKEAEVAKTEPSGRPTYGKISHGFVYERVPHITLKSIANNTEIDVIWEKFEQKLAPLRQQISSIFANHKTPTTDHCLEEWEIPREKPADWPPAAQPLITAFWCERIERQKEIDASIAARADTEYLYDKPFVDNKKVRVAGPFTVESLSPHRMLTVGEKDEIIDPMERGTREGGRDFTSMILEELKTAGVQQANREDRIVFTSLKPWPGRYINGEGVYEEGENERRAAVFIGPEFGSVARQDLVAAAKEAADADFDVLIACAFNYDAASADLPSLGRIPILKARMNADLHMSADLKNTGKGNLFIIFGEPDILVASEEWLVDSNVGRIAPYEIFKIISGFDSLEKIQKLDSDDIQIYANISRRREIWNYLANAAGSDIHPGEHRGRPGEDDDRGISAIAWLCAGFPGGIGNFYNTLRRAGISQRQSFRDIVEHLRRDRENAQHSEKISLNPSLTTKHYSQVTIRGVDVFDPAKGEVRSDEPDKIACWFIDTDYNEESFFVRHAYFLGANDPYKSLKTTLKAEIDEEAWESLRNDTSRPFDKPKSGRIAVKVINHLGDEVMKVYKVN